MPMIYLPMKLIKYLELGPCEVAGYIQPSHPTTDDQHCHPPDPEAKDDDRSEAKYPRTVNSYK